MKLEDLYARMQALQQTIANEKQTVTILSEQIEQSKVAFHVANGRIQEISNLIEIEKKMQQELEEEKKRLAMEQEQKAVMDCQFGENNGRVIDQEQE